jgi:hypothetical protein
MTRLSIMVVLLATLFAGPILGLQFADNVSAIEKVLI